MGFGTSIKVWSYFSGTDRNAIKVNMRFLNKFPVEKFAGSAQIFAADSTEILVRTSIMARIRLGLPVVATRWHPLSVLLPKIAEYQANHLPDYASSNIAAIQRTEKRSGIRIASAFYGALAVTVLFTYLKHKKTDIWAISSYCSLGVVAQNWWDAKQFAKSLALYNYLLIKSGQKEIDITPDLLKKIDKIFK